MLMNSPVASLLDEEFCVTQALMIISGRGRSSCAMILRRSRICASSPGLVSEKTRRSGWGCWVAIMATPSEEFALALGVGVPLEPAGVCEAAVVAFETVGLFDAAAAAGGSDPASAVPASVDAADVDAAGTIEAA